MCTIVLNEFILLIIIKTNKLVILMINIRKYHILL